MIEQTRADAESHATNARIKQLASAVVVVAGDAESLDAYKLRVYEATCDALRTFRGEVLDSAATKLDAYIEGRKFMGADDSISASSAARMVRALKEILDRA